MKRAARPARGTPARLAVAVAVLAGAAACADLLDLHDRSGIPDDAGSGPSRGDSSVASPPETASPGDEVAVDDAPEPSRGAEGGPSAESGTDAGKGTFDASLDARVTPEGFACLEGGADADPCLLAAGLDNPLRLTSDDNNVYWVEVGDSLGAGNGSVRMCPVRGCSGKPTVYAANQMDPKGIAIDGINVYWSTTNPPDAGAGAALGGIWSCPLTGACDKPTLIAHAVRPYSLTSDGTYVYWTDPGTNGVYRAIGTQPGSTQVLNDGGGGAIPAGVANCVVDSQNVYVSDFATNVFQIPLAGGDPSSVAPAAVQGSTPYGLAIDSTSVYYGQGTQILALEKFFQQTTVLASDLLQPVSIAIDSLGSTLYWSDWGSGTMPHDGKIGKVGSNGMGGAVLLRNLVTPQSIAVSGSYALWVSAGALVSSNAASAEVEINSGELWRTGK